MSCYTTGDLAKLAGVSVRTVQFYHRKGLLPPSQFSEGGRRLYSQEDLGKLQRICLWKTMGLSLDAIQGILESPSSDKVLTLLLEQQAQALEEEIHARQRQLKAVRALEENLKSPEKIPVNSIEDMEQLMNSKKKLRKIHVVMIAWGILADLVQVAGLVLWIVKGIWLPFVGCLALAALISALLTRYYYRNTEVPLSYLRRPIPAQDPGIPLLQTHPQKRENSPAPTAEPRTTAWRWPLPEKWPGELVLPPASVLQYTIEPQGKLSGEEELP